MEYKEGLQTSEFWVSVTPLIAAVLESVKGDLEARKYMIICGTVLGVAYIVSRTFVKCKHVK